MNGCKYERGDKIRPQTGDTVYTVIGFREIRGEQFVTLQDADGNYLRRPLTEVNTKWLPATE